MNISDEGLKFIINQEGFKLDRYPDVAGFLTIGVGHRITGLEQPAIGESITNERCSQLLKEDVQKIVNDFNENDGLSDIPDLTQSEFDACVSLAFNIGIHAFDDSTVFRKIDEHDFPAAGNAFLLWNKSGGKVVQGLVNRRNAEYQLFLKGE